MQKLTKSIAVVALFSLLIIGCDTNDPEPVALELKPSLFVEEDFRKEYIYNDVNQLTEIRFITTFLNGGTMTSTQNFEYLSNGKMKEATSDTGFKFTYTYEGDRITRTDEYVNGTWSEYHTFAYDSRGRLTERIAYQNIPEEGGIIPTSKDTYLYDENGNLAELRMYYYTSFGAEAVLQTVFTSSDYDDKLSTEDLFEINIFNPYVTLRKNNPGKLIIQNGNGNVTSTELYTYQYNPMGYVTNKTTHITWYHGGTGSYTSAFTFDE